MLVTLSQISEVSFHLTGTNGFYLKEENGRFSAVGSCCRQNLKFEISRRYLTDYIKKLHQRACRTVSSQSCSLSVRLSLPLLSSFLKLSFNALLTFCEPFPLPQNLIIIQISHVFYSYFIWIRAVQYPGPSSPITCDNATTTARLR